MIGDNRFGIFPPHGIAARRQPARQRHARNPVDIARGSVSRDERIPLHLAAAGGARAFY